MVGLEEVVAHVGEARVAVALDLLPHYLYVLVPAVTYDSLKRTFAKFEVV